MLKLRKIKKNNGIISAQYEPENSSELGYIKIDVSTGKLLKSKVTKFDDPFPMYQSHAVDALKRMIKSDTIPEEKVIMWY